MVGKTVVVLTVFQFPGLPVEVARWQLRERCDEDNVEWSVLCRDVQMDTYTRASCNCGSVHYHVVLSDGTIARFGFLSGLFFCFAFFIFFSAWLVGAQLRVDRRYQSQYHLTSLLEHRADFALSQNMPNVTATTSTSTTLSVSATRTSSCGTRW